MRNICISLLLVLSFVIGGVSINAQTRPRRVGNQSQPAGSGSIQQGSTTSRQAPVLRGTRTAGSQQPNPSSSEPISGPEEVEAGDVIKVNTTLVTLPVSVTDRDGRYIPNLRKEDFRLWEDGVEQQVAFFASVDKPFSLVLMLDTSGSTRFRIEEIQDAAITFVNQLRPDDRVMVVSFDDDVRILSDFTGDRGRLRDAIRHTRTGDGTKLYDAVDMVINQQLSRIPGRKAIVLFTDGVDTTSRRGSYASNVRDAEELDALIYPVQYDTYRDVNSGGGGGWPGGGVRVPTSPIDILIGIMGGRIGGRRGGGSVGTSRSDYERGDRYLRELAERTGARGYQADSVSNLSYAFAGIADELRRQYSLGYYPSRAPRPGERRQVRVRVNQPNLAVRTRDSYVFGGPETVGSHNPTTQQPPVLRRKFEPAEQD
ncbi:MAG TPA: VWA domain-containing protein [Pyrinomonadaceae bacterium]|nr:VWA domain-containing protein [Pyrinomonadaceae bacterium]